MTFKTIFVKTTGTCNLNCDHCFTNGKSGDKTHFDPVQTGQWVKEFIAKYSPDTHHHLELHGGEPFLVPVRVLTQFAAQFRDYDNVSMCANSNLTFKLTPEILSFIDEYLGQQVGTSWDYWIRWSNQKQFDLWKSNLAVLKARGVRICLKVSVSRPLVASTADWFLDQMDALGVDEVALERITVGGNSVVNMDVFPDNEEQDNWYLALYKRYKERNPSYDIKTLDLIEQKLKLGMVKVDTNCRNCEQNVVTINSNGTLGGCPNVATEHRHATIQEPVKVFLESDGRVNEIVKELDFSESCVRCDVFDLCGGDCHRLPWQEGRCGGLKNTLRHLSGRSTQSNLILKV
jgi:radical SAM protein with 4Fe4S-binding SPASM domain